MSLTRTVRWRLAVATIGTALAVVGAMLPTTAASAQTVATQSRRMVDAASIQPTGGSPLPLILIRLVIRTVGPNGVPDGADRVVDVAGWSTANRGRVHMWAYRITGNVENQRWNFVDLGGGLYQIVNNNSGKCLDKSMDFGNVDGELVYQYSCFANHPANQLWWLDSGGLGSRIRIRSAADNRCLDIRNKVDADDATVQVWGCNSVGWNQAWWITSP